MTLVLKVMTHKGLPLAEEMICKFDQSGGAIGRKADNTMVLPDAEHFVSGHHASIVYQDGHYFLQDHSTNGTYLLNTGQLLHNAQTQLTHHDLIRVGEYDLQALIEAAEEPVAPIDFGFKPDLVTAKPAFLAQDAVLPPHKPWQDDVSSNPFAASTPAARFDTPLAPNKPWLSGASTPSPFTEEPTPFKPWQPPMPAEPPEQQASFAPSLPIHDHFALPEAVQLAPAVEPVGIERFFAGLEAEPVTPQSTIGAKPDNKLLDELPPIFSRALETAAPPELIPSSPVVPAPAVVSPAAATGEAELMRQFLNGAGLSDMSFLPPEQYAQAMNTSGALFRALVSGLMDILRARAEVRSAFRVSVTTIRSMGNNPLKFNPDVDGVLKLLIAANSKAFMSPEDAIAEGFKDLRLHQMATHAGIQAALLDILQQFAPAHFESQLDEGGFLSFQKKSRCWELYCEKYPELKEQAMEEFFGDAFVEAYEKQIHMLGGR